MRARLLAAAMLFLVVAPAPAQTLIGAQTGSVLRLRTTWAADVITGTLLSARGDSIRMQVEGSPAPMMIAARDILTIERSRGRHGHPLLGSILGGAAGGVYGAVMGSVAYDAANDIGDLFASVIAGAPVQIGIGAVDESRGSYVLKSTMISALAGAGIGALVGLAIRTTRWERVEDLLSGDRAVVGGVQ